MGAAVFVVLLLVFGPTAQDAAAPLKIELSVEITDPSPAQAVDRCRHLAAVFVVIKHKVAFCRVIGERLPA